MQLSCYVSQVIVVVVGFELNIVVVQFITCSTTTSVTIVIVGIKWVIYVFYRIRVGILTILNHCAGIYMENANNSVIA